MTADEKDAVRALMQCQLQPGAGDKKFIRLLQDAYHAPDDAPLPPPLEARLWDMVDRYRTQHDDDHLMAIVDARKAG